MKNILHIIQEKSSEYSDRQKTLADYILANYKKVAFMTSTALANASGVSNPTVTRFTVFLGYSGYSTFQDALQKVVLNQISIWEQVKNVHDNHTSDHLISEMISSIADIPDLYRLRDAKKMEKVSQLITHSDFVFVAGAQWCSPLVTYTEYTLGQFKDNVKNISDINFNDFKLMNDPNKTKCAIIFALQRYPVKVINIIKKLSSLKIPMIIFTDSDLFPYVDLAEYVLYIPTKHISVPSIIPLCLVMFMVQEVICHVLTDNYDISVANALRFEKYASENNIYLENDYHFEPSEIIAEKVNSIYERGEKK